MLVINKESITAAIPEGLKQLTGNDYKELLGKKITQNFLTVSFI